MLRIPFTHNVNLSPLVLFVCWCYTRTIYLFICGVFVSYGPAIVYQHLDVHICNWSMCIFIERYFFIDFDLIVRPIGDGLILLHNDKRIYWDVSAFFINFGILWVCSIRCERAKCNCFFCVHRFCFIFDTFLTIYEYFMRHIRVVIKCLPCSALDIVQNWQFQIVWSQSIEYFMYKYFKYLCNGKLVLPKQQQKQFERSMFGIFQKPLKIESKRINSIKYINR